jgi:hypothetical protein
MHKKSEKANIAADTVLRAVGAVRIENRSVRNIAEILEFRFSLQRGFAAELLRMV